MLHKIQRTAAVLLAAVLFICAAPLQAMALPSATATDSQTTEQEPDQKNSFTLRNEEHKNYMNGGSDALFHPSQALSRAEFAQMLYNVVEDQSSAPASFSDVDSNSWYAPAVEAMAGLGILEGYSDGSFRPGQPITRSETAAAMAQLIPSDWSVRVFPDVSIDDPNYDAISAVGGFGLFTGDDLGNFNPDSSLTRAEAAAVFNRLLGRTPDRNNIYSISLRYFPDVPTTHWAYLQVMEATTSHEHVCTPDGEIWYNVQPSPVPLEDGFYRMEGRLYRVLNGQFLRSATEDVFTFDAEGRYTTGDAALDVTLNTMVESLTAPYMSRDEKLRILYNYCRDNFTYLKRDLVSKDAVNWEPAYASSFLSMGKGNCFSFAATYCLLARELGLPAHAIVGGLGKNADPHSWVEIQLDGVLYMYDPQLEWRYLYNYKRTGYDLFMVRPEDARFIYTR